MNYKYLNHIDKYQIQRLMTSHKHIAQIALLLGGDKSTISHELRRDAGIRGYRATQARGFACQRSESSRNARALAAWVKEQASAPLRLQWSPEQIAGKLLLSHESLCLHFSRTRRMAAPCVRICVARSKRESSTPVGETAGGKPLIAGPLACARRALKVVSKSVTGNATPSLESTTSRPSSRWWSLRTGTLTLARYQARQRTW